MKKSRKYLQGHFHPRNKEKYKGTFPIVYRSSFELRAFTYLDNNVSILSWGSESIVIPYICPLDKKVHRYYIDLNFTAQKKDGSIVKYWVEIKPHSQTQPPILKEGKKSSSKNFLIASAVYIKNKAKWEAATKIAKNKSINFILWTEKDMFPI